LATGWTGVAGCGDDRALVGDGAPTDGLVDAGSDGPMDGAPGSAAFHVAVTAIQASGSLPENQAWTSGLLATVDISVVARGFQHDLAESTPYGCTGDEFDLSLGDGGVGFVDSPPVQGDMGEVSISGYSGRGGGEPMVAIPARLTCVPGATDPLHRYGCAVPTSSLEEYILDSSSAPASFLGDGDHVRVTAAGGPAQAAFTTSVQAPSALTVTNSNLWGAAPFSLDAPLRIDFSCGTSCGVVAVSLRSTDDDTSFARAIHYGQITCTRLESASTGSLTLPATYLGLIARTPWKMIRTTVLRLGAPNVDASGRTIAAGKGQFFIATSH
jgi:hypothetical protein